jgi:predicted TIM-barrel fold metal-dependent hydrolase
MDMPLAMHIQAWRPQPQAGQMGEMAILKPEVAEFVGDKTGALFGREPVDMFCTTDFYIRRSTGEMIFSGVFERHPKLTLVLAEFDASYVPYHLSRMDHTYFEYPQVVTRDTGGSSIPFPSGMIPSDFWYRNIRVTFQEDPVALQRLRDIIGVKTMMWGNDYPHRESTWPKSLERIEQTFKGVPENEKALITGGNAAKVFKIN